MNKEKKVFWSIIGIYLSYLLVLLNIFVIKYLFLANPIENVYLIFSFILFFGEGMGIIITLCFIFIEPGSCNGWS